MASTAHRPPTATAPPAPASTANDGASFVRGLMERIPPRYKKYTVPILVLLVIGAVLLGVFKPSATSPSGHPTSSSGGGGSSSSRPTNSNGGGSSSSTQPAATSAACPMVRYTMSVQRSCGFPSLHGLWPDPDSSCNQCSNEKFNTRTLSPGTLADLGKYWPTCQKGWSNESFWSHEWVKHGTCSGMTQEAYFTKAMDLFQRYGSECDNQRGPGECRLCFSPKFEFLGSCKKRLMRLMR